MTHPIWYDRPPADVAILGAGMTGLAVAYYASSRGIRCTLLERGPIGCGASGRNVGMIITGLGEHYARSIATLGRSRARQIWEINRANHRLLRELLESEGIDCDYAQAGSFALAWDDAECADLSASMPPLHEDGFTGQLLQSSDIRDALGVDGCTLALYTAEDAQLHPVRLLQGLAASVARRGVPILENTPVLGIQPASDGFQLETPAGILRCGRLVLAANAYTPQLLRDFTDRIHPVRGQCLAAVAPDGFRFPGPCYADRGHIYWRSYGDRVIFGGFDQLSPATERTYIDDITDGIQSALECFGYSVFTGHWPVDRKTQGARLTPRVPRLHVTHRWSGVMGYTYDWFPLIGQVPGHTGMYVAAGFTGHGFGYALQAANWVAEALCGEPSTLPDFLCTSRLRL